MDNVDELLKLAKHFRYLFEKVYSIDTTVTPVILASAKYNHSDMVSSFLCAFTGSARISTAAAEM